MSGHVCGTEPARGGINAAAWAKALLVSHSVPARQPAPLCSAGTMPCFTKVFHGRSGDEVNSLQAIIGSH